MKVTGLLAIAVLVGACANEPATDRTPAPAPEPGVEATGGAQPAQPQAAVPQERPARTPAATTVAREEQAAQTGPVRVAAAQAGVSGDGAVLADFQARVAKYVAISKEAAKGGAKLKETADPAEIVQTQEALAARIRTARSTAKAGDIFTPEVRPIFRRFIAPELKGEDGADAKKVMKEDAPNPAQIPFKVNAKYPEGATLPTVPSNVLLNLPTLPEPLEYRIIGKHMVLLDTNANIIVDYMLNVMQ